MDPTATLTKLLIACSDGFYDQESFREAFNDLGEWLNNGGFLPQGDAAVRDWANATDGWAMVRK